MIQISPIPAFDDNYIWLLSSAAAPRCAVVDPGDEEPVIERLRDEGRELASILITHKHGDHTGGVRELKAVWPQAQVFGPIGEPINTLERRLTEGDEIAPAGLNTVFTVLDVPGHTEGHIAYFDGTHLFCGDTLFACGCGRVFSGTMAQLSESLIRLAALPAATKVYCAHEYTLANIGFAKWVEPENPDLIQRERVDQGRRDQDIPTVPSTLGEELATNPFMRTDQPAVIAAAQRRAERPLDTRAEVFRAIRSWKDRDYD